MIDRTCSLVRTNRRRPLSLTPIALIALGSMVAIAWPQSIVAQETESKQEAVQESAEAPQNQQEQAQEGDTLRWELLQPEGGGFQIKFPGTPRHVPRTVKPRPDMEVEIEMYTHSIREGRVAFLSGFHDVQTMPTTDAKRKEILDGGIKGAMVNVTGELTSHKAVTIGGNPARVFSYRGSRGGREIIGKSQLVLIGQRVIQISVIRLATQELDQVVVDQFFTSFQLDDELIQPDESATTDDGK